MNNYTVLPAGDFQHEFDDIYYDMTNYIEDIPSAERFRLRVLDDIAKLSYLAGTSPNRYVIANDGTKYYRYNVNENRHAVFYALDEKNHEV